MTSEQQRRDLIIAAFEAGKSATAIAKIFRGKIGRSTVFQTIKVFKESGTTLRKPHQRVRPVRSPALIKRIREKIRRNPARSINKLAKEEAVSESFMRRAVRKDLQFIPYKKTRRHLLSEANKKKRLERGRQILSCIKSSTAPPVLWTDEKLFTVQAVLNAQNDRVLARAKGDISVNQLTASRRQKLQSVMVWAGVTTDGKKTPLIFIEEGVKIDQGVYLHMLSEVVVPWVKEVYGESPLTFQQDSAPSHGAKLVQQFCDSMFSDFWPKELWPPCSPDMNPMDFSI